MAAIGLRDSAPCSDVRAHCVRSKAEQDGGGWSNEMLHLAETPVAAAWSLVVRTTVRINRQTWYRSRDQLSGETQGDVSKAWAGLPYSSGAHVTCGCGWGYFGAGVVSRWKEDIAGFDLGFHLRVLLLLLLVTETSCERGGWHSLERADP